jgi:hypothetical protein
MPTTNGTLGHRFQVAGVSKNFDTDIFVNVIKRKEEVLFRNNLPSTGANVAFVTTQEINSDINLSVADRSTSLAANRVTQINYTTIEDSSTFNINTENFVVTDIFTKITATNPIAKPLFYKHTLSTTNVPRVDAENRDYNLASGVSLVSAEIVDINSNSIFVADIKLDSDTGIIYNNLASVFNNGNIKTYIDLLDNETVFRPATFDDLTPLLTIIQDGRKVYLIEELGTAFTVVLPTVGTYAFQPLSVSRIEIVKPVPSDGLENWFVRVRNGSFFTNIGGILYKYYISEFLSQVFTPEPPTKRSLQERSTRLTRSVVKLDYENIRQDDDFELYIEILINDADGEGIAAFTTDPSLDGTIATNSTPYEIWNEVDQKGIKSIDHKSGIIELDGISLRTDYEIISSYYYNEEYYAFTLVNFNPLSNREALTTRLSLFIDPDLAGTSKDQTLFYLKSDQSGKVFESNWDEFDNDTESHTSGDTVYYERLPDYLSSGIADIGEPNYIDPATVRYFIDQYSVEGTQGGTFLVLGDVTVSEAYDVAQISPFDSRVRGGGVVEDNFENTVDSNPEATWFWDEGYWDGIPYPGNGSYFVEVPVTSLKGAGGVFAQKQIKDILNRHTAAGVYPLAKAYGVEIIASGIEPGPDSVKLFWHSEGL